MQARAFTGKAQMYAHTSHALALDLLAVRMKIIPNITNRSHRHRKITIESTHKNTDMTCSRHKAEQTKMCYAMFTVRVNVVEYLCVNAVAVSAQTKSFPPHPLHFPQLCRERREKRENFIHYHPEAGHT